MTQILTIHPENPQVRLLRQVVAVLQIGGVIAYPTDSGYALGCQIGNRDAAERIRAIRGLDKHHHFTLICRDLSELSKYAIVNNLVFRMLKTNTPGPYTFILPASKEVPR
ncbi:MAG: Sua5/YciO/YrdC/YwlC family protein, partial [Legionellales bacterium]